MASKVSVGDNGRNKKRKRADLGIIDGILSDATESSDEETDNTTESSPPSSPPSNSSPPQVVNTPSNAIQPINGSQLTTPLSISTNPGISRLNYSGGSMEMLEGGSGVSVDLEVKDGEYVVKIKRRRAASASDEEHNVEDTKQLAQSAGMLFLQAQILRDMGDQLLAQYRESLQYVIANSAARIDFTQN